ncbi:MAG: hypothetical protein ACLVIY_14525 [Anaerobutyricum soehngenii]
MCTGADDDERLLIKCRMNELVINIVSRFNIAVVLGRTMIRGKMEALKNFY